MVGLENEEKNCNKRDAIKHKSVYKIRRFFLTRCLLNYRFQVASVKNLTFYIWDDARKLIKRLDFHCLLWELKVHYCMHIAFYSRVPNNRLPMKKSCYGTNYRPEFLELHMYHMHLSFFLDLLIKFYKIRNLRPLSTVFLLIKAVFY